MTKKEQFREQLGLKPQPCHEYDMLLRLNERRSVLTYKQAVEERFRQTGRTTEMLLNVLDFTSEGKTSLVVLHSLQMAKHAKKTFDKMLTTCNVRNTIEGTDNELSKFVTKHEFDFSHGECFDAIFFDHVVKGEM